MITSFHRYFIDLFKNLTELKIYQKEKNKHKIKHTHKDLCHSDKAHTSVEE